MQYIHVHCIEDNVMTSGCLLRRYLAKEKRTDRSENFKKQESMISKQVHLLPDAVNTIIPASEHKEDKHEIDLFADHGLLFLEVLRSISSFLFGKVPTHAVVDNKRSLAVTCLL
jgi:hypothetical protein